MPEISEGAVKGRTLVQDYCDCRMVRGVSRQVPREDTDMNDPSDLMVSVLVSDERLQVSVRV